MIKNKGGITLIALVVTIVILLILAGISIAMLAGDNGIFNQAKEAKTKNEESAAREKLEIELTNFIADKNTIKEYNEKEYINNKLEEQGMTVIDDIVLVDGWQFQIDRSVPKIVENLGKGKENPNIKIEIIPTINTEYVNATLNIKITYNGEISEIRIKGNVEKIPTAVDGVYTIDKTIEENGTYTVVIKDKEGNYKIGTVKITDITEDMDIWNKADMEKFRDMVNSGRTFEGKTVRVMADIDLEGSETNQWIPIGNYSSNTSFIFKGIFEGNNHEISNIYINSIKEYQGLFGYIKNSKIKGIKLTKGSITSTNGAIGGIIGWSESSEISDCSNSTTVTGKLRWTGGISGFITNGKVKRCANFGNITSAHSVGGIVGSLHQNSEVYASYNTGNIKTMTTGSTNDNYIAGGIIGYTGLIEGENNIINSCYNIGDIYGYTHTGGIVGLLQGGGMHNILNCYSIGKITGNAKFAITGNQSGTYNGIPKVTTTNNYWLTGCGTTYGKGDSSNTGTTPLESDILKTYASKLGEAFTSDEKRENGTWKYNNGYPILKWQK